VAYSCTAGLLIGRARGAPAAGNLRPGATAGWRLSSLGLAVPNIGALLGLARLMARERGLYPEATA